MCLRLSRRCEGYVYEFPARRGERLLDDEAAVGLSLVLRRVRKLGGLVYLSGSGADEIISDYAIDGKAIYPHSCFNGRFPDDLTANRFFPWCSFYDGSQRAFIMNEELTAGAHVQRRETSELPALQTALKTALQAPPRSSNPVLVSPLCLR